MNKIDIYVDNATKDSGHTPRINPVFNKFLHIKLCITPESHEGIIAFQFAHELMHYIHYCHYGFERQHEDIQYIREENVCTAASLIVVHDLYPQYFCDLDAYVRGLLDIRYQKGAELAEQFKYNLFALKGLVQSARKKIYMHPSGCFSYAIKSCPRTWYRKPLLSQKEVNLSDKETEKICGRIPD